MKCPVCGSEHYKIYEHDPDLMMCAQCHTTHSKAWSIGYWCGHIDGERDLREQAKEALAEAIAVIYLNDNSDYLTALWAIVRVLNPEAASLLEESGSAAYDKYCV